MQSLTRIRFITTLSLMLITFYQLPKCQSPMVVTRIYTDYHGWWDSGNLPGVTPDTSHVLLGFEINNITYSTGVDDAKLSAHSIVFNPQKYNSLPVSSSISPQYIGVGYRYGGPGNVLPIPVNFTNPSIYLTDGTHGLDLGTALYNSIGTITYQVPFFNPNSIGDGIPDILITQMGQPSSQTSDEFSFLDTNNQIMGTTLPIIFSSVGTTGKNLLKFYTVLGNSYNSSLSKTTRDIRIVGYDFSDFGITATNYTQIGYFLQKLSGESDQAFIAYNKSSISVLPVEFKDFTAEIDSYENVNLKWSTASEKNNAYFTIDKSKDGHNWKIVTEVKGAGNSSTTKDYEAIDQRPFEGISYYRLLQTDFDGKIKYFPIIRSIDNTYKGKHNIFPNPTENTLHITGSIKPLIIEVIDAQGRVLISKKISISDSENSLDVSILEQGVYYLKIDTQILRFLKI